MAPARSSLAAFIELCPVELRVRPLSEEASAVVVRTGLGARADAELCRSCHEATGGNPFYLRELTTALATESSRPSVELARRVRELGAGTVGRSVLVRSRVSVAIVSDWRRLWRCSGLAARFATQRYSPVLPRACRGGRGQAA